MSPHTFFEFALRRFDKRISLFMKAKKSFSIKERIKVANFYLLPMFFYPMQFVRAPIWLISHVRNCMDKWILPLWRSLPMDVLTIPKQKGGFAAPLRDLELVNNAAILSRALADAMWPPERDFHFYDDDS